MASLPIWMEGVINRKYPKWREVEHYNDGSAKYMPAGVRLVEKSLEPRLYQRRYRLVLPDDLDKFVGPNTPRSCRLDTTIRSASRLRPAFIHRSLARQRCR